MKKELSILWMVTIFVLLQIPITYSVDCDPPGTVYREGCPREVLSSSNCQDCDPTLGPNSWCITIKSQNKIIQWADRTDTVSLVGGGQNGVHWTCDFPSVASIK